MLGLSDRTRSFDLFEAVMRGEIAEGLGILGELHDGGADPAVLLEDLLELTHFVTRIKLTPGIAEDPATPEAERTRGKALADKLGMASLARTWQVLLKGLGETRTAPHPLQAAEMVLIRLAHASELPSPADLVKRLEGTPGAPAQAKAPAAAPSGGTAAKADSPGPPVSAGPPVSDPPLSEPAAPESPVGDPRPEPPPMEETGDLSAPPVAEPEPYRRPETYEALVDLVRTRGERRLAGTLSRDVRPVRLEGLDLEVELLEDAPRGIAPKLQEMLRGWSGEAWQVSVAEDGGGAATLHELRTAKQKATLEAAERDPLVQAVKAAFPGAEIVEVREAGEAAESEPEPEPRADSEQPEMKAGIG